MKKSRTRDTEDFPHDKEIKEFLKRFEEQLDKLSEAMRKDGYKVPKRTRHRHER